MKTEDLQSRLLGSAICVHVPLSTPATNKLPTGGFSDSDLLDLLFGGSYDEAAGWDKQIMKSKIQDPSDIRKRLEARESRTVSYVTEEYFG